MAEEAHRAVPETVSADIIEYHLFPMNILQLCNKVPYPPKDGGSHATWQLAKGLSNHGCGVQILSLNTSKHHTEPANNSVLPLTMETFSHDTRIRIRDVLKNLLLSRLPYNLMRFYSRPFEKMIAQKLREIQYDIILLEGLSLSLYIPIIRKNSVAKIVLRAHNVEHRIWEKLSRATSNPFRSTYYKILTRRLLQYQTDQFERIDALVGISQTDLETFIDLGFSGPAHHTPFALDPDEYPLSDPVDHRNVLFLGALDWIPNIEGVSWFAQNIWPDLHVLEPDSRLFIAGRNPAPELPAILKSPGIVFLGELDHLESFYNNGRIMVVPLKAGSGMRVKIIEGMARGLCVVTTTQGLEGIPAIHGEHVWIANTELEFLKILKQMIEDPSLCKEMGMRARAFARKYFDNFTHTKTLLNFFNSLV
jgi:glycosyltransferase involved in cell wall biosynthesis